MGKRITFVTVTVAALSMGQYCSPCPGPDLRALGIEYTLVARYSSNEGRIRITGLVDNYGESDYRSGPGQQRLELYEDATLVATRDFENVAVDETIAVSYERDWDTSVEIPDVSTYRVAVVYAPDTSTDGNPDNDDCQFLNNQSERGVAPIGGLFP